MVLLAQGYGVLTGRGQRARASKRNSLRVAFPSPEKSGVTLEPGKQDLAHSISILLK